MFLHPPRQRIQVFCARVRCKFLPAFQRRARRLYRSIHIRSATLRHLRDLFSRRRIGGLEIPPFRGSLPTAADEMSKAPLMPLEPSQRFFGILRRRPVFHCFEFLYDAHLTPSRPFLPATPRAASS